MINVSCPNCQSKLEINGTPKIGQPVQCSNCSTNLEIVWLFPITLDFVETNITVQPERSINNGFS